MAQPWRRSVPKPALARVFAILRPSGAGSSGATSSRAHRRAGPDRSIRGLSNLTVSVGNREWGRLGQRKFEEWDHGHPGRRMSLLEFEKCDRRGRAWTVSLGRRIFRLDASSPPRRPRCPRRIMSVSPSYSDDVVLDDTPALLEGLRNGERGAQERFFGRRVADGERVLFRMLGPGSEFEDLVHEAFIQSVVHTHTFRGDNAKTLRAWVRAVATRTAGKRIRRRQVRRIL